MDPLKPKDNFERSPHPGKWAVIDHRERVWGPFDSALLADEWARKKWPGVLSASDDQDYGGADTFEVVPLETP